MKSMKKIWVERTWHDLFEIGVFLKGINGTFEILFGSLILFVNKDYVTEKLFRTLANGLVPIIDGPRYFVLYLELVPNFILQ